jgi:hypothetical protein
MSNCNLFSYYLVTKNNIKIKSKKIKKFTNDIFNYERTYLYNNIYL